jgi:hypothetical protein
MRKKRHSHRQFEWRRSHREAPRPPMHRKPHKRPKQRGDRGARMRRRPTATGSPEGTTTAGDCAETAEAQWRRRLAQTPQRRTRKRFQATRERAETARGRKRRRRSLTLNRRQARAKKSDEQRSARKKRGIVAAAMPRYVRRWH